MILTPTRIVALSIASILLILLILVMPPLMLRPTTDGFSDAGTARWVETDPGGVPSTLVTNVVRQAERNVTGGRRTAGGNGSAVGHPGDDALPPTARLERSWSRRDGATAWEVRVCRLDACRVDDGAQCERVRLERVPDVGVAGVVPAGGRWVVVSRDPLHRNRLSSDALLLPGLA
jgi:hypothetical protein